MKEHVATVTVSEHPSNIKINWNQITGGTDLKIWCGKEVERLGGGVRQMCQSKDDLWKLMTS